MSEVMSGQNIADRQPVHLTEPAHSITELTHLAEVAGIQPIQQYYGGSYEGVEDSRIVRWRAFRGARVEVIPDVPLKGIRYKVDRGKYIEDNPRIDSGLVSQAFEVECYQVEETPDGTPHVKAWTQPNADGQYDIIDVPEGDATFRLVQV
jgi:hypothetical protein